MAGSTGTRLPAEPRLLPLFEENVSMLARPQAELNSGADLEKLSYLECVCREALRLNPVVNWFERQLVEPFQLLEWRIPQGAIVSACGRPTGRGPSVGPSDDLRTRLVEWRR